MVSGEVATIDDTLVAGIAWFWCSIAKTAAVTNVDLAGNRGTNYIVDDAKIAKDGSWDAVSIGRVAIEVVAWIWRVGGAVNRSVNTS